VTGVKKKKGEWSERIVFCIESFSFIPSKICLIFVAMGLFGFVWFGVGFFGHNLLN